MRKHSNTLAALTKVSVIILATTPAPLLSADGMSIRPGNWHFTTTTTVTGVGAPRESNYDQCITESRVNPDTFMDNVQQGCRLVQTESSASSMKWKVTCVTPNRELEGVGEVRTQGDSVSGKLGIDMSMNGQLMKMEIAWDGERIGDCES